MYHLLLAVASGGGGSNNNEIVVAAITAVATAFGSWLLFRGKKSQSQAEGIIEERKLLASEWGKFREAVDKSLENCRRENAELTKLIEASQTEIEDLKQEVSELKTKLSKQ